MTEFLILYVPTALLFFILSVAFSIQDCKELNAKLSFEAYRVNYKACFFKSLFFPLTLVKILYELIKNVLK